jgi:hypothetical protein
MANWIKAWNTPSNKLIDLYQVFSDQIPAQLRGDFYYHRRIECDGRRSPVSHQEWVGYT